MKERSPTGFALSFLMSRFGEKKRAELGCLGIISAVRWPTVPLFFFVRHEHAESRGMLSGLGLWRSGGQGGSAGREREKAYACSARPAEPEQNTFQAML